MKVIQFLGFHLPVQLDGQSGKIIGMQTVEQVRVTGLITIGDEREIAGARPDAFDDLVPRRDGCD
jgi:hypothetical protein